MAMRTERGAALIVCLWTLALLSMLALGLAYRMTLELRLTRYQQEAIQLVQMAKAALVFSREAAGASSGHSALNQKWSHDPELMARRELMGGTLTWSHDAASGRFETQALNGLSDEESRINLNTASPEVLARLPGLDADLAAAIVDWRDPDKEPLAAGTEEYEGYEARNGPFLSVDELLLVKGVSPERFAKARPWLSVHGSGKVNVNTASPETLTALGMEEDLLIKVLDFRRGEDMEAATEDDGVFKSVPSISQDLSVSMDLGPEELKNLSQLAGQLTVRSTYFRADLTARRGRVSRRYTVVFATDAKEKIAYWHESS
ncbi:MAG: type II secretion system minor pseudopilin GspK [Elusimicrobiota bacterium]